MKTESDSALLKDLERETDNANRWAGDLECTMRGLGVSCARVNDARGTIEARLLELARDLLDSADAAPMTAQAVVPDTGILPGARS